MVADDVIPAFGPVAASRLSTKQTVNESSYPAIAASGANAGNIPLLNYFVRAQ